MSASEKGAVTTGSVELSSADRERHEGTPPINKIVFLGSVVAIVAVAVWMLVAPKDAESLLGTWVGKTSQAFGWFYILLATAILVFVIGLAVSRYGTIRLGPAHSRPQYSTFSWAAMLFAAGIGTDLMFYSVAEPVSQYLQPVRTYFEGAKEGATGGTLDDAHAAPVWTMFHYGITGWGMYALMGMALGFFSYRLNLPLAVRSALYPIFGKRLDGALGHGVDIAAVLGTIFGVATSLGIGVVQLNAGLNIMFDIDEGTPAQLALIALAVVMAAVSATTGVDKGIRFLSQLNVLLAIGLAAWVLVTGKTAFLLNAAVENVGDFVTSFPGMTMQTWSYERPEEWMNLWTLFFWAWWVAWASFVGMFLARISKGRTIREFVAGTLIIPFSYIVMWVSVFGNSAIDRIRSGDKAFGDQALDAPQSGFYSLLQQYPGATFLVGLATFVGLLFYVTSADSGALVMSNLSSRLRHVEDDAVPWMRIVWAAITGLLTAALLIVGGITALQYATIIMGLPFAVVLALVMVGLFRALRTEMQRVDAGRTVIQSALSGRAPGQTDQPTPWRARISRVTNMGDRQHAERYLDDVVVPAFSAVVTELEENGVEATSGRTTALVDEGSEDEHATPAAEIVVAATEGREFRYRVQLEEHPVPAYGSRMVRGRDQYARLVVHLSDGGQHYDVNGWSAPGLIHDVLDQYERHLAFLRVDGDAPTVG